MLGGVSSTSGGGRVFMGWRPYFSALARRSSKQTLDELAAVLVLSRPSGAAAHESPKKSPT